MAFGVPTPSSVIGNLAPTCGTSTVTVAIALRTSETPPATNRERNLQQKIYYRSMSQD
jgi:hypothetical protein